MLKPPRTILALAVGSLLLGLSGAGAAVADEGPVDEGPGREHVRDDGPDYDEPGGYPKPKHALGKVVSRGPLKVRSHPSTHAKVVGKVYPHEKLAIECKERGQKVDGNDLWYLLDDKKDDGREPVDGMQPIDGTDGVDGTDDADGADGSDREEVGKRRHGYEEAWVSARYVKDITRVEWCRV